MPGFQVADLYRMPTVNPISQKARAIPLLNPVNKYGRVFFFSWFGFMVAFWAWYAFPPLLTVSIRDDLKLTPDQIANSNIVSLVATLIVRIISGPLCDMFGPRLVFCAFLLVGAIPTGLAPLVTNVGGLYAVRFFMGILGGSFVPCQVWTTAFFDKNVVGSANALTGGLGNAGGGVTYFIMPAVYDSLRRMNYTNRVAWRLTFLVPLALVLVTGVSMLLFGADTPDGPWKDRHANAQRRLALHRSSVSSSTDHADHAEHADEEALPTSEPATTEKPEVTAGPNENERKNERQDSDSSAGGILGGAVNHGPSELAPCLRGPSDGNPSGDSENGNGPGVQREARLSETEMLETANGEVVQPPRMAQVVRVTFSVHTWALMLTYMCSFGAELAINSMLSGYYLQSYPHLGQTGASRWAAMFGLLNIVTRPSGGAVADGLYSMSRGVGLVRLVRKKHCVLCAHHGCQHRLWFKRHWITMCGVLSGGALVLVGKYANPLRTGHMPSEATTFVLIGLVAVFLETGNGANFALVPHVHPQANGVVAGLTGAAGNLGGVLFAILFRFVTRHALPGSDDGNGPAGTVPDYGKSFWIMGVIHIVVNAALSWVRPIPDDQVGGH